MEIQIKIIGWVLIGLGLGHMFFPRYFNWKTELKSLSLINKQMMEVHTFFIAFVVILMGLLCLTSAFDLTGTSLGRKICLGFGVFWTFRFFFQLFVYSPKLWRGKRFETIVHVLFTIFWFYLSLVFLNAGLGQLF